MCESCHRRPATVRVRFHDHPPSTFHVCDSCAREAEGLSATVLQEVSHG